MTSSSRAEHLSEHSPWFWRSGSLWQHGVEDARSYVLDMLCQSTSRTEMLAVLQDMQKYDNESTRVGISRMEHDTLARLVVEATGGKVDDMPMTGFANECFVVDPSTSAKTSRTKEDIQADLRAQCDRMQMRWSIPVNQYVRLDEAGFDRPPTQWIAFEQLRYRWECAEPILVNCPVQAGFVESALISAWRRFTKLKGELWEVLAPSGVAAVQIWGKTLPDVARMSGRGAADMRPHPDESAKLQSTHGIIIDEISMLSEDTFREVIRVLQAIPLREECRHRVPAGKQIPMFGYRDIICAGDLRQSPPADGRQPSRATQLFHRHFEVFVLREDLRHEQDLDMQQLKELIAWGGCSA